MAEERKLMDEDDELPKTPYSDSNMSSNAMTIADVYAMLKAEKQNVIKLTSVLFKIQDSTDKAIQQEEEGKRRLKKSRDGQLLAIRQLNVAKNQYKRWIQKSDA